MKHEKGILLNNSAVVIEMIIILEKYNKIFNCILLLFSIKQILYLTYVSNNKIFDNIYIRNIANIIKINLI